MKQYMIIVGIIVIMLFSCTNQLEDATSVNDNNMNISENNIDTKENVIDNSGVANNDVENEETESSPIEIDDDFDYENAIEIRNANLWLKKDELKRLMLDGERYIVDSSLLEGDTFSHVSMIYPAMILSGSRIYNILENKQVLMLEDITMSLEEVWGKEVAVEGYTWYGDVEIIPSNFRFIDNAEYSQDMKYLCVSMHAFLADVLDSIVCIYDTENQSIRFIEKPFWGQVTHIEFAPDGKYLAYASYTGGDNSSADISILNYETMEHLEYINVDELVIDYENLEVDEWLDIYLQKMYWDQRQLKLDLEYQTMNDNENIIVDLVVWELIK